LKILKENKEIEYRITTRKTFGPESFFIKKQSEINRYIDVEHTSLTVYKTFEENGIKFRGSASKEIHPTASDAEIRRDVEELAFAAGFVKNRYYPLASPDKAKPEEVTVFDGQKLYVTLERLKDIVFKEDSHKNGRLSFCEFFVKRNEIRIINSSGVDVSYAYNSVYIEGAVTWKEDKEIEVWESYILSDESADLMGENIKRLFEIASKKPHAVAIPKFDGNVLLRGDILSSFFGYYVSNANAMSVFTKQSVFKAGESVQGENIRGDKVNIKLKPVLKGSSFSESYDADGFFLKEVELIKDGALLQYWGNLMSSAYLGTAPTGNLRNIEIGRGSFDEAELKKEPYLEILSFSDFHMEPLTGDFGSEIRLAYYFDGKTVKAVSGGSVSGNIKKVQQDFKFSKELAQFNNFIGPKLVSVKGVSISGE
jgi:predicted Zn-dependent protease